MFGKEVTQTGSAFSNTDDRKNICGESGYYLVAVMLYSTGEKFFM